MVSADEIVKVMTRGSIFVQSVVEEGDEIVARRGSTAWWRLIEYRCQRKNWQELVNARLEHGKRRALK